MKNLSLMIVSILGLMSFNAQAQYPGYGYSQPYANYPNYQQQTPAQLLEMGVKVLQNYISSGEINNTDTVINFLDSQLAQFFDFEQMARWAAGYHYNRMNSAQQYIFQSNLKKMFFAAFARIVSAYGDAQPAIEFLPARRQGYDQIVVTARVIPSNSYPIRLDFRFMQGPGGWKIYDIGTNGNSAVAYYRAYFNNLIRSRGFGALLQQ
jgi:ABC-type transporter MlaC component